MGGAGCNGGGGHVPNYYIVIHLIENEVIKEKMNSRHYRHGLLHEQFQYIECMFMHHRGGRSVQSCESRCAIL